MSRSNKFNPGQYTQAGRLTPDDAAREMAKQRQLHTGSPLTGRHPWPPPSATPAPGRRHESETTRSSEDRAPASAVVPHASPDRLVLVAGLVAGAFALGVAGLTLARRDRRTVPVR